MDKKYINLFLEQNCSNSEKLLNLLKIGFQNIEKTSKNGVVFPKYINEKQSQIVEESSIPKIGISPETLMNDINKYLSDSVKAGHPRMFKNVLPQANIVGLVGSLLGNLYMPNGVTGEDAGCTLNTEIRCASAISELAGYEKKQSGGIFTFGGTGTNLYAIKIGLIKAQVSHIKDGNLSNICVLGSAGSHYCHEVVSNWLGVGEKNFIKINVNQNQTININDFKRKFEQELKNNMKVATIMLSGGTTSNMGIDDIKEVYDFRNQMITKYSLDYVPHIHVDSVIGWAFLVFKNYNIRDNSCHFLPETLVQIQKILDKITQIKYADSFGVDFHKLGFVHYVSSMIIVKNKNDFDLLKRKKEVMTPLFHDDYAYNPGKFTLETSRSAGNMLGTWLSLEAIGIEGYQQLLGHAMDLGNYFRNKFGDKFLNGLYVINRDYFGSDVFLGCSITGEDYNKIINNDNLLQINNKITSDFFNRVYQKYNNTQENGFAVSKSSAAIYNKNGKAVIGIRIYPLSPYTSFVDMDYLFQSLMKEKLVYDKQVK